MSPLRSGSGTSPQRTRMLLEVVAKADTLVGPQDGTAARRKVRGQNEWLPNVLGSKTQKRHTSENSRST